MKFRGKKSPLFFQFDMQNATCCVWMTDIRKLRLAWYADNCHGLCRLLDLTVRVCMTNGEVSLLPLAKFGGRDLALFFIASMQNTGGRFKCCIVRMGVQKLGGAAFARSSLITHSSHSSLKHAKGFQIGVRGEEGCKGNLEQENPFSSRTKRCIN